jgi:adenylate cyclase
MFELVFLTGARAGQVIPLAKTMLAGRSPECQVEVPDPNASRQHCRFVYDGHTVMVADNNSSNGTFHNDVRMTAPITLAPDDVIRIGETRMRIRLAALGDDEKGSSSIFAFKEQDEDLSQSLMISVADLPKKIQSVEALTARLNAFIAVSNALVNINDLEGIFARILESLFEVFPQADRGFLMIGSTVESLEPRAVRQRGKDMVENLSVSTSICRHCLEKKTAILFDDSKSNDFDQGMSIVNLRIRSAMTVPLMVGDDVLGILQIDTPDRSKAFGKDDLELALAVSQQAAIALHNAFLLKKNLEQEVIRNNLQRFLPGPVAQQVIDGKLDIALGGRTCHGTILFSDLIGFTRISENLDSEQVVKLMNAYFKRMVPCIQQNGGSVDKFMGDAIMAVWGVPIDKGDSALHGAEAALAMQNALVGFNSLQVEEGAPQVEMGLGITTGTVTAGNIGYDQRMEYTVLGDTVNTAQRLESVAGRCQILISTGTWNDLKGTGFGIAMPPLRVKNKHEPVSTFSLRGVRVDGHEIALHLPVTTRGGRAVIIRRLADRTFLILHPADLDICAAPLLTAVAEWSEADLGTAVMEAVHPQQDVDGTWLRSQIKLANPSLAGLLDTTPLTCTREWDTMQRSGN